MPTSTSRLTLAQPVGTDAVSELRVAITGNATALDGSAIYTNGTFTNRSSAPTVDGNLYESTDVNSVAYYSAATSAWTPLLQLVPTHVTSSATAVNGQLVQVNTAGLTITLPTPTPGAIIGVWNLSGTGASPTTVTAGAPIYAQGVGNTSAFLMGVAGQSAIFACNYGNTWVLVSGQYDTGWVSLTLPSGWSVLSGYYTPAVRQIGDTVRMRGVTQATARTFSTSLPSGFAPASQVALTGYGSTSAETGFVVTLIDGSSLVVSGSNVEQVSFDGLSYLLS